MGGYCQGVFFEWRFLNRTKAGQTRVRLALPLKLEKGGEPFGSLT